MPKVCLIILDGLGYDTALAECGFLQASVEAGNARCWRMTACLPAISAPLYETIHTGLAPLDHGILGNEMLQPSRRPNVFNILKAEGRTAGVVAHSYFHTLYGGCPFDPFIHAEIDDPAAPVPYARYFTMEGYSKANGCLPSETDLCAETWLMAQRHAPDYLLLHSSSCDSMGHFYTADSKEYRTQAWKADNAIARLIPRLVDAGYDVLVTADHGMNADGHHGGDQPDVRAVPFYAFSDGITAAPDAVLDQRAIAPTLLSLIGAEVPETMTVAALTPQQWRSSAA